MQEVEIRDVWAHNLEEELAYIRKLVIDYPMVAMVCVLGTLWAFIPI
jgi:hypothetical protein